MNKLLLIVCTLFLCLVSFGQNNHEYVFGKKCTDESSPPRYRAELDVLVANNDTAALSKWLYSPHKELQAYGAAGFFEIWLKGNYYVVPHNTIKRIKKIKRSHSRIAVCSGCIYSKSTLHKALKHIDITEGVSRVSPAESAILNNIDSITYYVYGNNCGLIGEEPKYRLKLDGVVSRNDTTTLTKWLYDSHKELNAYAVEGYYTLFKNGMVLQQTVLDRIKELQQDESQLYTCRSCVYSPRKLKDALIAFVFN